jgi:hypothetical protein
MVVLICLYTRISNKNYISPPNRKLMKSCTRLPCCYFTTPSPPQQSPNMTLILVKAVHFSNVCCHASHMVITLKTLNAPKIKMDVEGIGRQVENWIQMVKDRVRLASSCEHIDGPFGSHRRRGISRQAERLSVSQK